MPVTTSYPGIYIQELQSSTHTITAAATSVTSFVGYTHPFKTQTFNEALQIFSFSDYERLFGGYFSSDFLQDNVALAVNQFFLNGGSNAWVVGLQAHYWDPTAVPPADEGAIQAATLSLFGAIQFTALEPVDNSNAMTITISNVRSSNPAASPVVLDTADIIITYSTRSETFRKVTLNPADKQNYIPLRIGTALPGQQISSLVTVSPLLAAPNPYGTAYGGPLSQIPLVLPAPTPNPAWTTYNPVDFAPVFQQDSSLDKISFNLLVIPGVADNPVSSEALAFCERKLAFYIMDPPAEASADGMAGLPLIADIMNSGVIPESTNGALYFPFIKSTDPVTNAQISLPPSGTVAGIYAATDTNRGVWKAPAGLQTTILNTSGVVATGRMTDLRQGTLNPIGVNCLRTLPGVGTIVFGARTLISANTALDQWKYVPVRRMALFIEQTLIQNLPWVIFEPNDTPLWVSITSTINAFMLSLYNQGAFQGTTPDAAFQVKCDSTTTTPTDQDNGVVNIIVAFAPLKPAEFVVISIAQLAGQTQTS